MTEPKQASKGGHGMRVYHWPPQPPYELEVVSVTSITGSGIPKPWLAPWQAKMVATYAVDNVDEWLGLSKIDTQGAIDLLKRSPYRSTSEKADIGTIVHSAVEAYIKGTPFTKEQLEEVLTERRVPEGKWKSTAGYIAGAMEFLFEQEPEIIASEATVYSRTHGYAGTTDLIAKMRVGKTKKPVIIDFKTSARIYDEVGLQLCAYANADFVGHNDGTETPLMPDGEPITDGVAVRLMPTGRYEPVAFSFTPELYGVFLAAKVMATCEPVIKQSRRPKL